MIRRRPKPAAETTPNAEKALERAKLPRGKKADDKDDYDWSAGNEILGGVPFENRKIG